MSRVLDIAIRIPRRTEPIILADVQDLNLLKRYYAEMGFGQLIHPEPHQDPWMLGNIYWSGGQMQAIAELLDDGKPAYLRSIPYVDEPIGRYLWFTLKGTTKVQVEELVIVTKEWFARELDEWLRSGKMPGDFNYKRYSNYYQTLLSESGYFDNTYASQLSDYFSLYGDMLQPAKPSWEKCSFNRDALIRDLSMHALFIKDLYEKIDLEPEPNFYSASAR